MRKEQSVPEAGDRSREGLAYKFKGEGAAQKCQAAAAQENALTQSAACRVGTRIWVVLSPSDPPDHQADVLGEALARFRSEFLEDHFMAPVLREFLERVDPLRR